MADEGAAGAVVLEIRFRIVDARGATDHGTSFDVARGTATVRAGRNVIAVETRPSLALDAAARHLAVRDDLVERIARCIAW